MFSFGKRFYRGLLVLGSLGQFVWISYFGALIFLLYVVCVWGLYLLLVYCIFSLFVCLCPSFFVFLFFFCFLFFSFSFSFRDRFFSHVIFCSEFFLIFSLLFAVFSHSSFRNGCVSMGQSSLIFAISSWSIS